MSKTLYITVISVIIAFITAYFFYGKPAKETRDNGRITDQKSNYATGNITILKNIKNGQTGGDVNRSYENDIFTISIKAEKIPDLTKDKFYAGWLIDESSPDNANTVYLGPLRKEADGQFKDNFVLGYKSTEDLRSYKKILITEETTDDQKPEKEIITGFFGK